MPASLFCCALSTSAQFAGAAAVPDRTAAIQRAIESCRKSGEVVFDPGTYSVSTLQLKPDCTYKGTPGKTILQLNAKNRFLFDLSERSNIRIKDLIFDANYLGGVILAERNAPVRNIYIENCTFRNVVSASVYPANLAIFSSWGIIDSVITNNHFENVAGGMSISTVQNLTISGNVFKEVTQGDAIFIAPNPVSFPSGDHLIVSNNTGTGLAKMGIEIFRPDPPNGSRLVEPRIENNNFSRFTATNDEGMGLSITHGDGAVIRNNTIDNSEGTLQRNGIGIEVIVSNGWIDGNTINYGFGFGIAVQGKPGSLITANRIFGMWKDGILFACDNGRNRCDSSGSTVEQNTITNARMNGIRLDNDWARTSIVSNVITRAAGSWTEDRTLSFSGIRMSAAKGAVTIRGNSVTQTSQTPPQGFGFHGIDLNPDVPGATISDNTVRSLSPRPLGEGMAGRVGAGWVMERNQFGNLAKGQ